MDVLVASRNEVDSAKVDGGLLGFDVDAGSSLAVLSVWFRGKYGRKQIALKFLWKWQSFIGTLHFIGFIFVIFFFFTGRNQRLED